MNNFCINYIWLILGEKLIDTAKKFKKSREDSKDLSLLEVIREKFDLHDFILNAEPDCLYLENLISDSLKQNLIPHQVFLKTYTADKLDYNKELGLNYQTNRKAKEFFNLEILKLFEENGKFQTKLNDFFKSVNKQNNIKFIMIDEAQEEILLNLQKLIPNEDERKKFKEDLEKMNDFYIDLCKSVQYKKNNFIYKDRIIFINERTVNLSDFFNKNKEFLDKEFNFYELKIELEKNKINQTITPDLYIFLIKLVCDAIKQDYTKQNFILKNLILDFAIKSFNDLYQNKQISAQKAYLIDFTKFISILYTNLIQSKDCLLTDFDTKKENLNSKIYEDENHVKFSFLSFLQTFIQFEGLNYPLSTKKDMLKNLIKSVDHYGNFCHAGLFFVPKSFINFSLFFVKNALEFSENPFLISNKKTIQEYYLIYFAHNFEWIMDDFCDFFVQNYKIKDFTKENYLEFENYFKNFIKNKYSFDKLIDKKNEGFNSSFLGEIMLKSFENHFYSGFLEKMHINNGANNNEFKDFVQGTSGESWNKNTPQETKDINEYLENCKKKYELIFKNVSEWKSQKKYYQNN